MACDTSSVNIVANGHGVGSLIAFMWTLTSCLAFLAGGGHIDLWLLDSQLLILLEGLIGGASIDDMS